jgi:hypothetical protein
MTQPLVQAGPGQSFIAGLSPSLDPLSALLWHDGENVVGRRFGVQKIGGWESQINAGEPILDLHQAYTGAANRAYLAGVRKVWLWEGGPLSELGEFGSDGVPYLETWGTWVLGTNGVNPIRLWKNTGTLDEIADAATQFDWAKLLHRRDVHVLALNTNNSPTEIAWCSASNVELWTPALSNTAGNYTIRDMDGEIIAVSDLGPNVAIYSKGRLVVGTYTGPPFIFNFQPALEGIGAVGRHAVVEAAGFNYGMSAKGIWGTDGVSVEYVDEPVMQKWINDNRDYTKGEEVIGFQSASRDLVMWAFPNINGGISGVALNIKNNSLWKLGGGVFNITAACKNDEIFGVPVVAIDGRLVFANKGRNAGGEALPCFIRTKPLDAGSPEFFKLWDYLRLTGEWTGGRVRLGALHDPNDLSGIEWFYDQPLGTQHFFKREAPFVVVELSVDQLDETFSVSQFLLSGEVTAVVI